MNFIKRFIIIGISVLSFSSSSAQEGFHDCINPKKILVPFTNNVSYDVQDEIYYQPEDKYTYWYKIKVESDGQLTYKLTTISKDDIYEILIYSYKGKTFCNDVIKNKEKPITNKLEGTISVKKGETYYAGVLQINGYGCGHNLFLKTGGRTLTIKAIQNECIEEAMETIVENIKTDTVAEEIKPIQPDKVKESLAIFNSIKGVVVNYNTQKNIEAVVTVLDNNGNPYKKINSNVDSGFVISQFDKKKIAVSVRKFGYETYTDTLDLKNKQIKIELNPIKVGEKLIMYKIYFYPNTYALKEESKQELKKLTTFMKENSNYFFEIQGHTSGNKFIKKSKRYIHLGEEWNFKGSAKKLSKMRAERIKSYLVEQGIKGDKLTTVGYGGDRMIVKKPKNMREAMKNIRVEVIVVN